ADPAAAPGAGRGPALGVGVRGAALVRARATGRTRPAGAGAATARIQSLNPTGERRMAREVFCSKEQRTVEGLDFVPWPGELGRRVFASIGKPAWAQWIAHQTMLINE